MNSQDLLKLISDSEYLKEDESHIFDELYIIQRVDLHDSGYHMIKIYGKRINENKMYILSKCSDVIHFEKISENSWFCSMDIPYLGIIRIFTRRHYRFLIPFTNISDFTIEFRKD